MSALILVVDDLEVNLALLQEQLGAEYFSVITADSGQEAIELATKHQPDIILLDALMPKVDGFAVCRYLRTNPDIRHIPIVMITAHDDKAYKMQGLKCGADDFLVKPISEQVLLARIENLVRLKRELDELRTREAMGRHLGLLQGLDSFESILLGEKGRTLILEDRNFLMKRLIKALEKDFEVETVQNEAELLKTIEHQVHDFFLISLTLAQTDGLRLCGLLRREKNTRYTPILAMLDTMDTNKLVRAFKLGINDCLLRPIDSYELLLRCWTQFKRGRYQHYLRYALDYGIETSAMDIMTGIYNRRYMECRLDDLFASRDTNAALEEKDKNDKAVALFDLDHFKQFNDTYGHDAGDILLKQFAHTIRSNLRVNNLFGRWGGEEFLLILEQIQKKSAILLVERLCHMIGAEPFFIPHHNQSVHVTTSVGLSFLESSDSRQTLLERVDKGLYQAKRQGRNKVVVL